MYTPHSLVSESRRGSLKSMRISDFLFGACFGGACLASLPDALGISYSLFVIEWFHLSQ